MYAEKEYTVYVDQEKLETLSEIIGKLAVSAAMKQGQDAGEQDLDHMGRSPSHSPRDGLKKSKKYK